MRRHTMSVGRASAVALIAAVTLTLTSCASEEDPVDADTTAAAAGPSAPADVTPATPTPSSPATSPTVEPTADTPLAPSATDCLRGSWLLDNQSFEALLVHLLESDPEVPSHVKATTSVTLSGASSMRFGDNGDYGAWQDDFAMEFSMDGQAVKHVQNAADIGQYEANDQFVWVSEMSQLYIEAEMQVGELTTARLEGGSQSLASVSVFGYTAVVPGIDRELVDGVAKYSCSADHLILHADDGLSARFSRIADIAR